MPGGLRRPEGYIAFVLITHPMRVPLSIHRDSQRHRFVLAKHYVAELETQLLVDVSPKLEVLPSDATKSVLRICTLHRGGP